MSTLIMPSSCFGSTSSIDRINPLQQFSDQTLFNNQLNTDSPARSDITQEHHLAVNHFDTFSDDFEESLLQASNNIAPGYMTSQYNLTPISTSSITSTISESSVINTSEEMTASAVTGFLDCSSSWGSSQDNYNQQQRGLLERQQSIGPDNVDVFSHSPQQNVTNVTSPNMLQVTEMNHVGSISPGVMSPTSNDVTSRRQSTASGSSHLPAQTPYQTGFNDSFGRDMMHVSPVLDSSNNLAPTASNNLSRSPFRNGQTYTKPTEFGNNMDTFYQGNFKYTPTKSEAVNRTTTVQDYRMQNYGLQQPDGNNNYCRSRQYRHNSYPADGRRVSNITPPSPNSLDEMYAPSQQGDYFPSVPNSDMEGVKGNYSGFGEEMVDRKPLLNHHLAGNISPNVLKKTSSLGMARRPKMAMTPLRVQSSSAPYLATTSLSAANSLLQEVYPDINDQSSMNDYNTVSPHNSPPPHSTYSAGRSSPQRTQCSPTDLSIVTSNQQQRLNDFTTFHPAQLDEESRIARQIKEQQMVAGVGGIVDLFGQYIPSDRDQYFPSFHMPDQVSSGQLHPSLAAASLVKQQQENDLYPYNGQVYLTIPSNTSAAHFGSFRGHYPGSERHHPYQAQNQRANNSLSMVRPSSEGLCAVCGDNAACQHYGVRTCEGCKGFFKRTVQKKSTYVCLANKNCPVDKRRRNRCQFCRFEKCLAVGMVKEVVRTDHLKGRRGRLPSKPKGPKDPIAPPSPPVSFITSLVRAHVDTNPAISNTDLSKYRPPGIPPCSPPLSCAEEAHNFYELLASCLTVTVQWAEKIPGFNALCQEDQSILVEHAFLEIFCLRLAYRSEIQEGKLVFCNGVALHREQLYRSFGSWIENIFNFTCTLAELNVDISSFSCLLAVILFQDRPGLRDVNKVEELQSLVLESLKNHVTKSIVTADRPNYFTKLIGILPNVSASAVAGVRRIYAHKIESPSIQCPPCLERNLTLIADQV